MLVEVWAASHEAHEFLYVRTSHRFRRADGIYLYELDRKTLTFKYGGIVFTKEALNEEREQFAESYKHLNNLDGEQSADGKPPEAPQLPK